MYKAEVMEDDLDLDLGNEEITRKDNRIKSLSDKVKLTSEERDEKDRLLKERDEQLATISKERDFLKNFSGMSSKYQGASEYQDKIFEKVNAGYDIEDATISILAKEGKYTPSQALVEKQYVAGGSASTAMRGNDSKTPQEMTQDERRAQLEVELGSGFSL